MMQFLYLIVSGGMNNNKRWLPIALIATIQLAAFMLAIVTMVNWTAQQQPSPGPGWWNMLVLSACVIGIAGTGLMTLMMIRAEKDNGPASHDLERKLSETARELEQTQDAIIFGLSKLGECRDTDTGEHLDRIRQYVTILATDLSSQYPHLDESAIHNLGLASSLHDIGKVGLPESILLKPTRFSEGERKIMQYHTVIGGEILDAVQSRLGENEFMEMARKIAWSHHERWDGSGYPHQLAGDEIPLVARIVTVADVYDALTTKRPYKHAITHSESRKVLFEGRGSLFDPMIIDAFFRNEEQFEAISMSQKYIADEDCISGLQRLADCVEAMQNQSTNLLSKSNV